MTTDYHTTEDYHVRNRQQQAYSNMEYVSSFICFRATMQLGVRPINQGHSQSTTLKTI